MKLFKFVSSLVLVIFLVHVSTAQATPKVDARQAVQEKRIDQGVANGSLSSRETRKLERQQARIDRSENKAKQDGIVTPKERKMLDRKQDRASRNIAKEKHDINRR